MAITAELQFRRLIERKKTHKVLAPNWEIHSSYPLRENIWEYLHDDKEFRDFACTKGKSVQKYNKQLQHKHKRRGKNFLKSLIFFLLALGVTMSMDYSTSVDAECCHRMRHLATELSRAQQALRSALRLRRNLMQTTQMSIPEYTDDKSVLQRGYVEGSKASKGSDTTEWGWRVSLWGVVPLWRASPPPDTILALRTPTPSDCWPFSGSYGEVIIELAHKAKLNYISIEHVRPDTARSAPKNFVVYGTFENNTRLEIARGIYTYNKPAKQYFALSGRNEPVTSVAFKVLSNQGNTKYTCVYRVHLYGSDVNKQKITS